MPQPMPYAGWLHAIVMQYQVLASFHLRLPADGVPALDGLARIARCALHAGRVGLFGGQLATLLGALGWSYGIAVGALLTLVGWVAGISALAPMLWRETGITWHARSCFAALTLAADSRACRVDGIRTGRFAAVDVRRDQDRHFRLAAADLLHRRASHVSVLREQCGRRLRAVAPVVAAGSVLATALVAPRCSNWCTPTRGCGLPTCRCSRCTLVTVLCAWLAARQATGAAARAVHRLCVAADRLRALRGAERRGTRRPASSCSAARRRMRCSSASSAACWWRW